MALKDILPAKLNNEVVGTVDLDADGGVVVTLDGDHDLVRQLALKMSGGECAGLALLPVRMPSEPRPEFSSLPPAKELSEEDMVRLRGIQIGNGNVQHNQF